MRTNMHFLKRLTALALAAFLLAAAPTANAAPASARQAWLYNQGSFKVVQGTTWIEKNPTGVFHFKEAARNGEFVDLYDQSRKMTVRLYPTTMYWKLPTQKAWNYLYHGRFEDTQKQPLNEDRFRGERGRLDTLGERRAFPHLGKDFEVLGPATKEYNCIAFLFLFFLLISPVSEKRKRVV